MLADSGEDAIAFCPDSDYAANVELAVAVAPATPRGAAIETMEKKSAPGKIRCEDVAEFLVLFGLCAFAYLVAFAVHHALAPKFEPISAEKTA